MADIDDLLARVLDDTVRNELTAAVEKLRSRKQFGLVFEDHIPETVRLPHHTIRRGVTVVRRDDTKSPTWEVISVVSGVATLQRTNGLAEDPKETAPITDLVVVAEFGQPIYPGLRHLGSVKRGGERPAHVVIKGENHHVLEALSFTHVGKI